MTRILITPQELDEVAAQFKQANHDCLGITTNLTNKINSLNGRWAGMTQQRFFQEYEMAKKNMDQFLQNLDQINIELTQIALRFRQADQQS